MFTMSSQTLVRILLILVVFERNIDFETYFNPANICIALLKFPIYQQVIAHRTIDATIALRSWKLVCETTNCWMNDPTYWKKTKKIIDMKKWNESIPLENVVQEFEYFFLVSMHHSMIRMTCPMSNVLNIAMVVH